MDNIPRNSGWTTSSIEMTQNQKATQMVRLANSLMLKVGTRVMLTVNIDVEDRLINRQIEKVSVIECSTM